MLRFYLVRLWWRVAEKLVQYEHPHKTAHIIILISRGMGVGSSFWRRVVLFLFICLFVCFSTPKVGDYFVFKSHKWVRFSCFLVFFFFVLFCFVLFCFVFVLFFCFLCFVLFFLQNVQFPQLGSGWYFFLSFFFFFVFVFVFCLAGW